MAVRTAPRRCAAHSCANSLRRQRGRPGRPVGHLQHDHAVGGSSDDHLQRRPYPGRRPLHRLHLKAGAYTSFDGFLAVPEPATWAILLMDLRAAGILRRRTRTLGPRA